VHPGRVLEEQWMKPCGISQNELARMMRCSARRVNEIVHGRRSITADSALRLSRCLGLTPHYWMALQSDYEIDRADAELRVGPLAGPPEPPPQDSVETGSHPSRPIGWPRHTPEYRAAKRREAILSIIEREDLEEYVQGPRPGA
jgi:addiction module HigA family antidote